MLGARPVSNAELHRPEIGTTLGLGLGPNPIIIPLAQAALAGAGAEVMQAVPTMLELVPAGVNKWVGMRALLADLVRSPLGGRAWERGV